MGITIDEESAIVVVLGYTVYCRWEKAWLIFNEAKGFESDFQIVWFLYNMLYEHMQTK